MVEEGRCRQGSLPTLVRKSQEVIKHDGVRHHQLEIMAICLRNCCMQLRFQLLNVISSNRLTHHFCTKK